MTLLELKKLAQSFKPEPLAEDEEYDCNQCAKCTSTIHVEAGNEWENGFDLCWDCLDEWHSGLNPYTALRMIELLERAHESGWSVLQSNGYKTDRRIIENFIDDYTKWLKDLEEL